MKHILFYTSLIASTIFVSSCGEKELSITELKAKQAELKTQLNDINEQINKLQSDSAQNFILVNAEPLKAAIFKSYISVQGRVDAEENVSLSSQMPGTIIKINVKAGDGVMAGQVLAETDARAIQQSISDLQTNTELVNQLYEKQKALWEQKIGTEVQYLQAKTQKESMEKKMAALQEQLRMTKIISPIDGTVDAVDIKLGQLTAPGMPAIRVVNFKNLKLKADLAESYTSRVKKGDEVMVRFPDSNDTLTAPVNYASRAINPLNRTFGIEILLPGKKEFHPNQIAVLNINDYKSVQPAISIPVIYLQKDVKGNYFVLIAENNKAVKRNVNLGKEYNGVVEIKDGLKENDLLITEGAIGLNEGENIKVKTNN
jgi:membrane fusion protein (multidrug efflux system)